MEPLSADVEALKREIGSCGHFVFFFSLSMSSKYYVCPFCHEKQEDAWVVGEHSYIDPDNGAKSVHCPTCDGVLSSDFYEELDG